MNILISSPQNCSLDNSVRDKSRRAVPIDTIGGSNPTGIVVPASLPLTEQNLPHLVAELRATYAACGGLRAVGLIILLKKAEDFPLLHKLASELERMVGAFFVQVNPTFFPLYPPTCFPKWISSICLHFVCQWAEWDESEPVEEEGKAMETWVDFCLEHDFNVVADCASYGLPDTSEMELQRLKKIDEECVSYFEKRVRLMGKIKKMASENRLIFTSENYCCSSVSTLDAYRNLSKQLIEKGLKSPIWIRNTLQNDESDDESYAESLPSRHAVSFTLTYLLLREGIADLISVEDVPSQKDSLQFAHVILDEFSKSPNQPPKKILMKINALTKTREVYYQNIANQKGYCRGQRPLEFVQEAVASLPVKTADKSTFFGLTMQSGGAFQTVRKKDDRYYAELVLNKGAAFKYLSCKQKKILELFALAWQHPEPEKFLDATKTTKWQTRHAVLWKLGKPSLRPKNFTVSGIMKKEERESTLGHGDHWRAVDDSTDDEFYEREREENFLPFLAEINEQSKVTCTTQNPWMEGRPQHLVQQEFGEDNASFKVFEITLIDEPVKKLRIQSIFPVFQQSCRWLLKLTEVSNAYGNCEGLVIGQAASGHQLEWFAPDFLSYAHDWAKGGIVSVHLSGLALRLEKFEAKSWKITEGPALEAERQRLIKERKAKQATRLKHVTVIMNELRTLYSSQHDHAEIIGRVLEKRPVSVKTWREIRGFVLELEVMPDNLPTGHVLPVYVFPSALGDYSPRRGDLVSGLVWLQGHYGHAARKSERALFAKHDRAGDLASFCENVSE